MNIYLQFFTQITSNLSVDLVGVPGALLLNPKAGGVAQTSAGGKLTKRHFANVESFVLELAKTRLNEIEINYDIENVPVGNLSVRNVSALFKPSPLSDLWYPAAEFDTSDRQGSMREMNALKEEECLNRLGILRAPSALEVVIDVGVVIDRKEMAEWITDNLCRCVAQSHAHIGTFGCADFFEQKIFVRLESNLLILDEFRAMSRLLPTAYADFGSRFEDVHDIMFGAPETCDAIAKCLGERCKVSQCPGGTAFTVLQIYSAEGREMLRNRIQDRLLPTVPIQE